MPPFPSHAYTTVRLTAQDVRCIIMGFLLAYLISFTLQAHAEPPSLKRPMVALDPGHGGLNYGAIDPRNEGRYEKEYTLIIAKKVRAHLRRAGVKVWMSRTKDMSEIW